MSTAARQKRRPNLVITAVSVAVLLVGGGAGTYLVYSGTQDAPAPQATPSPAADLMVEDQEARDMLEENGDVEPLDLDSLLEQKELSVRAQDESPPPGSEEPSARTQDSGTAVEPQEPSTRSQEPSTAPQGSGTAPQAREPSTRTQGSGTAAEAQEPSARSQGSGTAPQAREPEPRTGSRSGGIVDVGPPVLPEDFDPDNLGPYVRTTPVPASMGALRLQVPSIYVDAGIVPEGISAFDRDQYGQSVMELPDSLGDVGWLNTTAALRSTEGTTLLAGHVTVEGVHGAVYFLGLTEPGALVKTTDADGRMSRWVITEVTNYAKTALPEDIFRPTGPRQLAIVTCGGEVVQLPDGSWSHEENIVVLAVPVD